MSNANQPLKKSNTTAIRIGQGRAARRRRTSSRGRVEGSARTIRRTGWFGWVFPIAIGVMVGSLVAWGMWSSRDGSSEGQAVQPISTIEASDYHSLLIDPQDAEHVLFGSHEGSQESRDGGYTWQPGSLRGADAMIIAASPDAPETIYAAGHDVFQVSRDDGASWQPVMCDLPGTDIHGLAQNPSDPQRLYAFVVGAGGLPPQMVELPGNHSRVNHLAAPTSCWRLTAPISMQQRTRASQRVATTARPARPWRPSQAR